MDQSWRYITAAISIIYFSAANKYYFSAGHHEQKNEKNTSQIKF